MQADFIAIDWGTTNRRIYLLSDGGEILHTERDDKGITAVPQGDFDAAIEAIRARFGKLPMLLAGMVGSDRGWIKTPYVSAPATLELLAEKTYDAGDGIFIIPGVSYVGPDDRCDVMRGEEVQLLGACAGGMVPATGLLCQPGTHCKWAWMDMGALVSFTTTMTGELFAMLKRDSLLSTWLDRPVDAGPAFRAGLIEARRGDVMSSLFGARAAVLLGQRDAADVAPFVSGLLIGNDVGARLSEPAHVVVLADAAIGGLYALAIETFGGTASQLSSHDVFVSGITSLRKLLS